MAQAKLWEEAFLKEMESFQRSTVDKFQVAFSAEVGALQSPWVLCLQSLMVWVKSSQIHILALLVPECPGQRTLVLTQM